MVCLLHLPQWSAGQADKKISFDFFGDTITFAYDAGKPLVFTDSLSNNAVHSFFERMPKSEQQSVVDAILAYKQKRRPDDWVYYQLIRRAAQSICPKADNYYLYTLCKCYLLGKSGYAVALNVVADKLLLFIQSDDEVYDIPFFSNEGKKYVCLNYHDYHFNIDFEHNKTYNVAFDIPEAQGPFSYKLMKLPDFRSDNYHEKDLAFSYHGGSYHFKIKLNDEVKKMFANYPVVDYSLYLNEPLSPETYNTLIPQLKEQVGKMSKEKGIDYLMHFTRYAFAYEPDQQSFGREKHLFPEQTLLYENSDCEDRVALFYYLVKEIYNLPMVVLAFPHHATVAVRLDKPVGRQIVYNDIRYSVCEPTPQEEDLPIGALPAELSLEHYQVAYAYYPPAQQH